MYQALLVIHSLLRWVVVLLAIAAIVIAFKGWLGKEQWEDWNKKLNVALLGSTHLQVVIGLLLYVGVSPIMKPIFADMGAAMKSTFMRFWAVEHITTMILGAVAIHVAHVLSKKATEDAARFKRAAIGFTIGFLLIMAGIPWPMRPEVGRGLLPF